MRQAKELSSEQKQLNGSRRQIQEQIQLVRLT